MLTHVNLRHAGFINALAAAVGAQFSFISLFNFGRGEQSIAVRDVQYNGTVNTTALLLLEQGEQGTGQTALQPAFPIGVPPNARLNTGSRAATPAGGYKVGNVNSFGSVWLHDFPFCVLDPGWSITLIGVTVNQALTGGFWVDAIYPEYTVSPSDPR